VRQVLEKLGIASLIGVVLEGTASRIEFIISIS